MEPHTTFLRCTFQQQTRNHRTVMRDHCVWLGNVNSKWTKWKVCAKIIGIELEDRNRTVQGQPTDKLNVLRNGGLKCHRRRRLGPPEGAPPIFSQKAINSGCRMAPISNTRFVRISIATQFNLNWQAGSKTKDATDKNV